MHAAPILATLSLIWIQIHAMGKDNASTKMNANAPEDGQASSAIYPMLWKSGNGSRRMQRKWTMHCGEYVQVQSRMDGSEM